MIASRPTSFRAVDPIAELLDAWVDTRRINTRP
jgi:hypothetical protein